ncbi:MAG: hypothetical protein M3Q07_04100 [Pseudobdellovibrionaceae bacterium]|nr:hypothetical protein [Pseudobdellovibrionaceae bacterium]
MLTFNQERGNASLASVFGLVAVLGLYMAHDQHKTQGMRSEVLSSSLSSIAKQANETALSRTRSLLRKNSSGQAAVNIQNQTFTSGIGAGFQIQQGALLLQTPDPRSADWVTQTSATPLTSRVFLEKVNYDASGRPLNLIAVAETAVQTGSTVKSHRTRARFDLLAMNPPPPSGGNAPAAGSPVASSGNPNSASGPAVASSTPTAAGGPCGGVLAAGNSTAASQTGANTSNSSAQGQNTGTSAQTTQNSASGCAASQTGGNSATAMGSGTGGTVTTRNTASTTGNTATSSSHTTAVGAGPVSASTSATTAIGGRP